MPGRCVNGNSGWLQLGIPPGVVVRLMGMHVSWRGFWDEERNAEFG